MTPLSGDVATIGRSLDNTVVLADAHASRRHARIACTASGWEIANLSQRQPVWVSGVELGCGQTCELRPGALLQIGETHLQFLAPARGRDVGGGDTGSGGAAHAVGEARGEGRRQRDWLRPGITFQFAMSGRSEVPAWRLVGLAGIVLLGMTAALTLIILLSVGQQASLDGGTAHALAAGAVALIPALATALLVLLADRYEREPWPLLAAGFLWGAVVAIPLALVAESAAADALTALPLFAQAGHAALAQSVGQAVVAGAAEEAVKGAGLAVLLLVLRDQFDNVTDGILYGVVVGAGFAVVEDFTYLALSPPRELPWLFVGRIVLGWLGHSTFCALFGAGLGLAREAHRPAAYLRAPALAFLAALGLHTLFDGALIVAQAASADGRQAFAVQAAGVAVAYGSLFAAEAALFRLLSRALRREAAVIREHLAEEVIAGWVTPDEYALVQDAGRRWRAERDAWLLAGPPAYLTSCALHQAIVGLAMRNWHVAHGEGAKATAEQPEDAYRRRIAQCRASLLML